MSTSDWIVLLGAVPLILASGAWSSVKVWARREDVSGSVEWAIGSSGRAGFQAAQLPLTIGFALIWLSLLLAPVWNRPAAPSALSVAVGAIGVVVMFSGFWLWLVMWPKFMLPPQLRGQPGWIKGAWNSRKSSPSTSRHKS